MNDFKKITNDIVRFSIEKINEANLPVNEETTLKIVLSLCEILKKNLDYQEQANHYLEIIERIESYCDKK